MTMTLYFDLCEALKKQVIPVFTQLFWFIFNIEGSTPERGCERWKLEAQKCFMNSLFVLNQNQANCHRWQLFGR